MATRRARLWRWRRNPLRRRSDIAEAWVVLAGWVLALVGGLLAGLVTADSVERAADRQRVDRRSVSAILAEDAEDKGAPWAVSDHRVRTKVRWTAPDGSIRTDEARVAPKTPAGNRVTVWIDKSGSLVTEPVTDEEAEIQAAFGGVLAAMGAGAAVSGAVWLARRCLYLRRIQQWAAEWERIDTRRGWKTG
ncbi:hypothetical protein OHA74_54390 [Streptomyces phaeochromogenes]|uniref:Rv1733c family protein n=1 Tax=Streptomyces phaeochromogenes TaxID=1923 RepID=UPI002E2914E0|nr:hypothetical protein [Streptomyces phaeochromogenes]